MDRTPHFSRVADTPECINPVTGRSMYYGLRPWRCDDRAQDLLAAFVNMENVLTQARLMSVFWKCARAEPGKEPVDDYLYLTRKEVMYYVERRKCGMLRDVLLDPYPYNPEALKQIQEEDALKMRLWRHQRELEIQSKEGKVDDLIAGSVFDGKGGSKHK